MSNSYLGDSSYKVSFIAGGLLRQEAVVVAEVYQECLNWSATRETVMEENLLQVKTRSASTRLVRECVNRLSTLNDAEIDLVVTGSSTDAQQMLWLAACRQFGLIRDFATDVIRENFLARRYDLTYEDFDAFVSSQTAWHPELLEFAETTRRKVRATLFNMLREAGVLDNGAIQNMLISSSVLNFLNASDPSDIRFFPTSQYL